MNIVTKKSMMLLIHLFLSKATRTHLTLFIIFFPFLAIDNAYALASSAEVYAAKLLNERDQGKSEDINEKENNHSSIYSVELLSRVYVNRIRNIAKYGMLNTFQIGHRSANYNQIRKRFEEKVLGISGLKYDQFLPYSIYPKYGYLNYTVWKGAKARQLRSNTADEYGNVVLVFRSEVAERVTYSLNDSLAGRPLHRIKDLNILEQFNKGDLEYEGPHDRSGYNYTEIQIWGPLNLSHVREILVDLKNISKDQLDFVLSCAKKNSLPVFEMVHAASGNKTDHLPFSRKAIETTGANPTDCPSLMEKPKELYAELEKVDRQLSPQKVYFDDGFDNLITQKEILIRLLAEQVAFQPDLLSLFQDPKLKDQIRRRSSQVVVK